MRQRTARASWVRIPLPPPREVQRLSTAQVRLSRSAGIARSDPSLATGPGCVLTMMGFEVGAKFRSSIQNKQIQIVIHVIGGGSGIRTHEGLAPLPDFKSGAFDHSAIPPKLATTWRRIDSAHPVPRASRNRLRRCTPMFAPASCLREQGRCFRPLSHPSCINFQVCCLKSLGHLSCFSLPLHHRVQQSTSSSASPSAKIARTNPVKRILPCPQAGCGSNHTCPIAAPKRKRRKPTGSTPPDPRGSI